MLLAINTGAGATLAGSPNAVLPAGVTGAPGLMDITGHMAANGASAWSALESQRVGASGYLRYAWIGPAQYTTGTLTLDPTSLVTGLTISVAYYGADPTGVADSSPAFNSAMAALGSAGGRLLIPPGTFLLNSDLNINRAPIVLDGAGGGLAAATTLKLGPGVRIICIGKAQWSVLQNFAVQGNIPAAWSPATVYASGAIVVNQNYYGAFRNLIWVAQNGGNSGIPQPALPLPPNPTYPTPRPPPTHP